MLTEQPQPTASLKPDFSPDKLIINLPTMDKLSDFPLIFAKHRRNEYSGYKQINLNKSKMIAEIIKTNNRSLKVLDFRWNEIGEIGAQIIYPSLAFNASLKSISL
jgi:hypothetical protein